MALTKNSPGCCCGECTTNICVTSPCADTDNLATNVTVTVKDGSGSTVFSGTTTSTVACFVATIPAAGSYTVATSGNARYADTTGTYTLGCGGTVTINLSPGDGFVCACFANEPVSENLVITGPLDSATVPSNSTTNFTLAASVPVLTPSPFTSCNTGTLTDPCATGTGTLDIPFTFTRVCNDVQQGWVIATDCTVSITFGGGGGGLHLYGGPSVAPGGTTQQWGTVVNCFGYQALADSVTSLFPVPQSVPINFTVSFLAGIGGTAPPIASITITEAP